MSLLEVNNLNVRFKTNDGLVHAVNHVSFSLDKAETLGVVGESGSGKSQTVLALMGLSANNALVSGSAKLDGKELIGIPTKELNQIRGNEISMIFQDPMTSLNPYVTIETQLCEPMMVHQHSTKAQARRHAIDMLDAVRIPDIANRIKLYPHELSGGMQQRVMVAMALMCKPRLLIADEPTTALDVTVQAQLLKLLQELQDEFKMATILITHDIAVVAGACDRVMVMYAGTTVESAQIHDLFANHYHPYTYGLMTATPRVDSAQTKLQEITGEPPDLSHLPAGCAFSPRCPRATDICSQQHPVLEDMHDQNLHYVACFHARETDNKETLNS